MKKEFTISEIKKFLDHDYNSVSARMLKSFYEIVEDELENLKKDERLYYKTADVFSNSPLALIQCSLGSQVNILESILGLPLSRFPLKKEKDVNNPGA